MLCFIDDYKDRGQLLGVTSEEISSPVPPQPTNQGNHSPVSKETHCLWVESLSIPCGFLISMLGAGPLRDTVTSLRLGSKGNCQVLLTPLKWSEDSRWTLDDCTASSTHFRTYSREMWRKNAGITDRFCCGKLPVRFRDTQITIWLRFISLGKNNNAKGSQVINL